MPTRRANLETRFIRTLASLRRGIRRVYDAELAATGLSAALAWPVVLIGRSEGMRQRELADQLDIEGPSLVRLLDQLCAMALVARTPDPDDGRAKTLHLTREGRAMARRAEAALDRTRTHLLHDISERDLRATLDVFDRVASAIDAHEPHADSQVA